jgi:hypothetical protein
MGVKQRIALWGAVAVVALAAVALVATRGGGDADPPVLRLAAYGSEAGAGRGMAEDAAGAGIEPNFSLSRFVAADDLPSLGGEAPAYSLSGDAGDDEIEQIAEAYGIEGDVTDDGAGGVAIEGDELTVTLFNGSSYRVYRTAGLDTPESNAAPGTFDEGEGDSSSSSTGSGSSGSSSGGGASGDPGAASVAPSDAPAVCLDVVAPDGSSDVAQPSGCGSQPICPPMPDQPTTDAQILPVCDPPMCPDWFKVQEEPGGFAEPTDPTAGCEPPICPDDTPNGNGSPPDLRCMPPVATTAPPPAPGTDPVPLPEPLPDPAPVPLPEPLPGLGEPVEGLPSEDEARAIGLETLAAAGLDVDDAEVTVIGGVTQWDVQVEPRVGDLPAPGLAAYVAVGVDGRIEGASGPVGDLDELGDYPLVETRPAIDRLNEGWGLAGPLAATSDPGDPAEPTDAAGAAEGADTGQGGDPGDGGDGVATDLPARIPEPEGSVETLLTDAEVVLMNVPSWDGDRGVYLLPGYRFTAEDGSDVVVPAVVDDLIDAQVPESQPVDPGSTGGPAVDVAPAEEVPAVEGGTVEGEARPGP